MLTLTTVVNLLALAAALWQGFYIITRSPRSRVSWLAALTLWSVASFHLHNVMVINVPQRGLFVRIRPLVLLALPLWCHLTLRLKPEKPRRWFPKLALVSERAVVFLMYGIALVIVIGGVVPAQLPPDARIGTMAYLSGRVTSAMYPFVAVFLACTGVLSLLNLWQLRADRVLTRSFSILFAATTLAVLGGFYISVGVALRLDWPTYPGDTLIGAGVVLLGYAVARYNALIEVRAIERDFWYSLLAVGLLTAFYYLGALILYFGGQVSFLSLMLVIAIAISSHALYDGVRVALDRLFYQKQFRQLRANLRALARDAGAGQTLAEQLQAFCRSLCRALRIRKGFIALRTEEGFEVKVAHRIGLEKRNFSLSALSATEMTHLSRPDLQDMALLVPLFAAGVQLGALVLGAKESEQPYGEEDLDLIDDLADQMAHIIHTSQLQAKSAEAMNQLVADFRIRERTLQQQMQRILGEREVATGPVLEGINEKEFRSLVEDGLRRLHEYPYLGDQTLAQLQIVNLELGDGKEGFVTHIDRGKALNKVLLQALHKLRPEGAEPPSHQVPAREWHQFIILHDAYVLGEFNRDIMSRLYIGEGTFNRTRRRALRGVARALMEMEEEAQRQAA